MKDIIASLVGKGLGGMLGEYMYPSRQGSPQSKYQQDILNLLSSIYQQNPQLLMDFLQQTQNINYNTQPQESVIMQEPYRPLEDQWNPREFIDLYSNPPNEERMKL